MENSTEKAERAEDAAEILGLSNCKDGDTVYLLTGTQGEQVWGERC